MAWYDEAVFYHIYPLGLTGAPKENDYGKPVNRMKELTPWIKHIKEMGFTGIYIGPLFESVGHGYETTDYKKLDSRLGTNKDLTKFVSDCHEAGIKVIFDGVFNHVGRDFFAFQDLKEKRENSVYKDWFCNVNFYGNNEYNDGFSYENWGGYNLLVKLNQRNEEVKSYILDAITYWVKEFDVDGIRLDAADVLDFDFMRTLRNQANSIKEDFWLMGEVIHGDYNQWVNDQTLHSVTNYVLHKALYSGHNDHNYYEIAHTVNRLYEMGGNRVAGLKLYNFVDNHDVERIVSKVNNKNHLFPIYVLDYTLPGVPSVYYGSEFGIEGKKEKNSDDSLRPALNYKDYKNEIKDNPLTKWIAALGKVRQETLPLSYGEFRQLMLTNRQYAFVRSYQDVDVIVTVNNDDNEANVYGGGVKDGTYVGTLLGGELIVSGGDFSTNIPACSGEIWIPENMQFAKEDREIVNPSAFAQIKSKIVEIMKTEKEEPVDECSVEECSVEAGLIEAGSVEEGSVEEGSMEEKALEDIHIGDRTDYENMSIKELQAAILEKMAKNGPVTEQMRETVIVNEHMGSLLNWVRSFR